jgi:hypothetical protein
MARFDQKNTYVFNLKNYINAVASSTPGKGLADRKGKGVWISLNQETDSLAIKGPMTGVAIKQWAYNIVANHPSNGTRGGTDKSAQKTASHHITALVKTGSLIPI